MPSAWLGWGGEGGERWGVMVVFVGGKVKYGDFSLSCSPLPRSYGCAVNYARGGKGGMVAAFK